MTKRNKLRSKSGFTWLQKGCLKWNSRYLWNSIFIPSTHTTLFWRPYDVVWTLWTLYRRQNDVVCLLDINLNWLKTQFSHISSERFGSTRDILWSIKKSKSSTQMDSFTGKGKRFIKYFISNLYSSQSRVLIFCEKSVFFSSQSPK